MTIKPARPRLALSIGVIGHRPNRLPEAARAAVETRIDALLATLRQATDAAHARYAGFEEYGDGEHYHDRLKVLQSEVRATEDPADPLDDV